MKQISGGSLIWQEAKAMRGPFITHYFIGCLGFGFVKNNIDDQILILKGK